MMCWGMIAWNYKGPLHIREPETKKEKAEAEEIKGLNEGWLRSRRD